jgi:hypothetical protein
MIKAVQAALDDQGIDDTIREVGQFEPRGMTGALFAGGMAGGTVGDELGGMGGAVGTPVGSLAGMAMSSHESGLPLHMMVGASDAMVYGFKMAAGGRRSEPHVMAFQVPREHLEVKVHGRVNVRILELIDGDSGSKIELEGNRLPITHSHDLIKFLAGEQATKEADAEIGDADSRAPQ